MKLKEFGPRGRTSLVPSLDPPLWWIQDFPEGDANSQSGCANLLFCKFFAENSMKMNEFGP